MVKTRDKSVFPVASTCDTNCKPSPTSPNNQSLLKSQQLVSFLSDWGLNFTAYKVEHYIVSQAGKTGSVELDQKSLGKYSNWTIVS